MSWEQAGVWLVGIGSAVVVAATILGAPSPGKPRLWLPLAARRDRVEVRLPPLLRDVAVVSASPA
jgi:hypothetical protein